MYALHKCGQKRCLFSKGDPIKKSLILLLTVDKKIGNILGPGEVIGNHWSGLIPDKLFDTLDLVQGSLAVELHFLKPLTGRESETEGHETVGIAFNRKRGKLEFKDTFLHGS